MKKTIFLLNIGNYEPKITKLTYPLIEQYAKKIDADVHVIKTRKFPKWSIDYEKMQIYELGKNNDWVIYFDSDVVVHPDMPDLTELFDRNTVIDNSVDFAPHRWKYDKYFRRDGRHIGVGSWLVMASNETLDVFRPLDDLTPEQASSNISVIHEEKLNGMKPAHLQADYAMSRNIAKYGLKFQTFEQYCKDNVPDEYSNFLHHLYNISSEEKLKAIQDIMRAWSL